MKTCKTCEYAHKEKIRCPRCGKVEGDETFGVFGVPWEPASPEDLSGHTELFGWRFKEGGSHGLVELLIEDDDFWYPFIEFDVSWIKDFHQMSTLLLERHHDPL